MSAWAHPWEHILSVIIVSTEWFREESVRNFWARPFLYLSLTKCILVLKELSGEQVVAPSQATSPTDTLSFGFCCFGLVNTFFFPMKGF